MEVILIGVILLAGLGAGIITGLFGGSAVLVAVPVLVVFAGLNPYIAIGISLAIDVFSSAAASVIYHRNDGIKLKPAWLLIIFALIGAFLGSYFSNQFPPASLAWVTGLAVLITGLRLSVRRTMSFRAENFLKKIVRKYKSLFSVLAGLVFGSIAGIFGAGGGIIIFFTLIVLLGYETHKAIGTSILVMIFIASVGAIGHYIYQPFSLVYLGIGIIGGIMGALTSSKFVSKINGKTLDFVVGISLFILGSLLFLKSMGVFQGI